MNSKYIKLSIQNAKFFPKNIKTKDFTSVLDVTNKGKLILSSKSRSLIEITSFKEAITVHHISNMLHTMIGERPIPSFRKTFYKRNEDIFDLANKSYLKITSPKTKRPIKGVDTEVYIDEFSKVNKSPWNSWTNNNTIQWFKIRKYLGGNFDEFINIINTALGYDVLSEAFENLRKSYDKHGSKLDIVIDYVKQIHRKPIADFLTFDKFNVSTITNTIGSDLGETIISGIDNVFFINGEILIPYEQSFVDKLTTNTTNILDGGFVKIVGIYYEDELNDMYDYIKVSDISDEKY